MPPITSSRPGARLTRIGRARSAKSKSADSSAFARAISAGTGSSARSSRLLTGLLLGLLLLLLLLTARLQNDPVEQAPALQLEAGRQHVRAAGLHLRKRELKGVHFQFPTPPRLLVFERHERRDPRVHQPLARGVREVAPVFEQFEDH